MVVAGLAGGACTDGDEPTGSSENRGEQQQTPTTGATPPGNPEPGETGTDGSDTGSR